MRAIKIIIVTLALSVVCSARASGQVHERYEGRCERLQGANSPELVEFLNSVIPDGRNARCLTWAIHKLGTERYDPAIVPLVRLLDFSAPQTEADKAFRWLGSEFPAEEALTLIGKKALPELLRAITASTSSDRLRENAVFVWMEIYRQSDQHVKGVALLKQEQIRATDDATKDRLEWAVSKAIDRCNPPEVAACRQAAATGAYGQETGPG